MKVETAITPRSSALKAESRVPAWVMPAIKSGVAAADAVLSAVSFILAFRLREGGPVFSETGWAWSQEFVPYAGIFYFAVIVRLAMLVYQRAFNFHGAFSYAQEFIRIFKAVSVASLLMIGWAFLFRGGFAFRDFSYSRGVFVLDFAIALLLFSAFHLAVRAAQVGFRRRDINLIPTLVVGTNQEAAQTIAELAQRPELGYRVMGVVDCGSDVDARVDLPIVGGIDDLPEIVKQLEIQEVIITDARLSGERLFDTMMQVGRRRRIEFRFAPSLFDLLPQKTSVEQIGVLPMVRLFREPLSDVQRFVKRASDILIALPAAFVLSPLLAAISIIIKSASRGPVLFRQERVGMDGRIFLCYKFRTMFWGADEEVHREAYRKNIAGDGEADGGPDDATVYGKVKNDSRVTPLGRWLRRSSLDELPQLLNVLKGDMSVVGPRPPIPYEVEEYDLRHRKRLDMKPGLTGLWQVSGRSRLPFEEMVRIDIFYIENWSVWLDLKIILLTLPAILRGDGAR